MKNKNNMLTKEYVDKQFEQLNDPNFDINKLDKTGRSLLFLACKTCDFEKIKKLVELKCDFTIVDNIGYDCLLTVSNVSDKYENKLEIIKYFINDIGIIPNKYTNKNESCLYLAVKANNLDIAEYFLREYSDMIEIKPLCGSSCLEIAITSNNICMFNLLLKYGANVNDMNDESGMSCLMIASLSQQYDMVKILIESGAEINMINFKNKNALYYATYHVGQNDKVILYLLENGAFICDRTCKFLSRSQNILILKYLEN